MADSLSYGALDGERELGAVARMLALAFGSPIDGCKEWLTKAGLGHVRVLREGGVPVACLLEIPMGQFFGGASVPMMGIAGVAVPPECRGRGLGRKLMEACIDAIAERGVALSCLYASTQSLYRLVGYEQAGHRFITTLPWSMISGLGEFVPVRALTDDDKPAVEACYREFARRFDGTLDRGPYCWARVREVREDVYHGFGIERQGAPGLEGYLFLTQKRNSKSGRHDVVLSDMVFLNERAGRGLIRFIADMTTMAEKVEFAGGPLHPIVTLMPQQRYKVEKRDYWMLRLTDVRGALERRGYPRGASARLGLELTDSLVPANAGRWTLRIENGRAQAERGGSGPALKADVRGLASMYSGLYTPRQAQLFGWVEGSDDVLDAAAGIFGSGTPWMADMF